MAKRRIFQIAKELNISHTDILSFLKLKSIEVGSHMAPIEEDVYQIILAEFHKDKESVERYRKEQVRREIHDTRILDRQKENKKLNILTMDEQRKLESKEREKIQEEEKKKEEDARNVALKQKEEAIAIGKNSGFQYQNNNAIARLTMQFTVVVNKGHRIVLNRLCQGNRQLPACRASAINYHMSAPCGIVSSTSP